MKNKTSYLVKDIDKDTWKKFRGTCLLNGYNNAGECIVDFINGYAMNVRSTREGQAIKDIINGWK